MLLNTDMELAFDIDVDNTGHGSLCTPGGDQINGCPEASTRSLVAAYATVCQCLA